MNDFPNYSTSSHLLLPTKVRDEILYPWLQRRVDVATPHKPGPVTQYNIKKPIK